MSARPAGAPASGGGGRAQPFYCPYCGEQDFRPAEEAHGAYHCECCDRRFAVRFLGLGPGAPAHGPGPLARVRSRDGG